MKSKAKNANAASSAELFDALDLLKKEKGIDPDYMQGKIAEALRKSFISENQDYTEADNICVEIDRDRKSIEMFIKKIVVEGNEVNDPIHQMTMDEALRYAKNASVGAEVRIPVDTRGFRRVAAANAKQMIIQGIREAERNQIFDTFTDKQQKILTGTVSRIEPRTGAVSIKINSDKEYTEAMLAPGERIRGEELVEGQHIKVYVAEVRKSSHGPQVLISRTHPDLVRRLFELEVPEVADGTIEIRSVAREAGSRTKISVISTDSEVDPIGACIGPNGGRVKSVVNELSGEKIDVIKYSDDPEIFIASALSPAEVLSVTSLGDDRSFRVIVPDDQLSLAIGKEGQNARLAAKLTGFKIDIKPKSAAI